MHVFVEKGLPKKVQVGLVVVVEVVLVLVVVIFLLAKLAGRTQWMKKLDSRCSNLSKKHETLDYPGS